MSEKVICENIIILDKMEYILDKHIRGRYARKEEIEKIIKIIHQRKSSAIDRLIKKLNKEGKDGKRAL